MSKMARESSGAVVPTRGAWLIAVFASAAICAQNAEFGLGVGWGLIHGAGPAALLAFLPLALGLAALWTGYTGLQRRNVRGIPVLFTIFALAVLLVNEALLPATPLKSWRARPAIEKVEVRNIRDDVFLSPRGNPTGIRFTFEVLFPEIVLCNVSAPILAPITGEIPSALQFARVYQDLIDPAPSSEGAYHVFKKGTLYTVTEVTLPNFLSYDQETREPCLRTVTTETFSEADFLSALSRTVDEKYRMDVVLTCEHVKDIVVAARYVTSRDYGVRAMYSTIAIEGNGRCRP